MAYIYKIQCKGNERVYVGYTRNIKRRFYMHLFELRKNQHHNKKFQDDFNLFGEESFSISCLEEIDARNQKERENFWIENLKSIDEGYNQWWSCQSPTLVFKLKTGRYPNEGKKNSEESKEKTRRSLLGRKHTEERRLNQSEAKKRLYASGYVNPKKGTGKPKPPKSYMPKDIRYRCLERKIIDQHGRIFDSIKKAEESLRIENICRQLKGKRKSVGKDKLVFRYLDS